GYTGFINDRDEVFIFDKEALQFKKKPRAVDPDVKKFGATRNLNDIKQKPLRNILKEMNDDIGHVGAFKMFGYGRNLGTNDPFTVEAAKDLRAAIKWGHGRIS